jgi:hypothetical protein
MLDVVVPATQTIDSMGLLVVRVLASRPSMPRRAAVNITAVNISSIPRQRGGSARETFSHRAARCLELHSPFSGPAWLTP